MPARGALREVPPASQAIELLEKLLAYGFERQLNRNFKFLLTLSIPRPSASVGGIAGGSPKSQIANKLAKS
jgi:hypothetical protein